MGETLKKFNFLVTGHFKGSLMDFIFEFEGSLLYIFYHQVVSIFLARKQCTCK